jgi:DNA mismatch repair protein MutL
MQHKFPFVVLHFDIQGEDVDVNVHPTKMEVRFSDEQYVYKTVVQNIITTFRSKELIVNASFGKDNRISKAENKPVYDKAKVPEPYMMPKQTPSLAKPVPVTVSKPEPAEQKEKLPITPPKVHAERNHLGLPIAPETKKVTPFVIDFGEDTISAVQEPSLQESYNAEKVNKQEVVKTPEEKPETTVSGNSLEHVQILEATQETLFGEQFLSEKAKETYEILGQIFGTYWIVAYSDRMYMIDQHAAHEKVKYERLVKAVREKEVLSQSIMPPVIIQTSAKEEQVVLEHFEAFLEMGFEIEEFGDHTFCMRAVPVDLFGCSYQELFREIVDEMMEGHLTGAPDIVLEKLASMACKAAVKGNMKISREEAVKLIDELLTLENPYHCPHGRPTIISMNKQEIEKKFKRIV